MISELATPTAVADPEVVDRSAEVISAHTLFGCVVRELAWPEGETVADGAHLVVTLTGSGQTLRARLRRTSTVGAHRFTGPVRHYGADGWTPLDLTGLAELVAAELAARTGVANDEFAAQVIASGTALADLLATRPNSPVRPVAEPAAGYLDSEQALLAGHPRHPSPKWRSGGLHQWRRYAPESRGAFPLRWLSAPAEVVRDYTVDGDFDHEAGTATILGDALPADRLAMPVHPWQYDLLTADPRTGPVLAAALEYGILRDHGRIGLPFHPTSSVRTLYQPELDRFLKTSLNVRITNCLRKNSAYELAGAPVLSRVLAEVGARWPGFGVLAEPAARSVALPQRCGPPADRHAVLEGLGTIVRAGIADRIRPGERVHLAGTLAAAQPDPCGTTTRLAALADPADGVSWARTWWRRYLDLLVPPVLTLWARHGIVLEPHPQNVLVVLGADNLPTGVLARDLEGTKLVGDQHAATLAAMPADVARAAAYDEERGRQRIGYCLFVNHLTELAGALADLALTSAPGMCRFEDELWTTVADVVAGVSARLGSPPRLRALIEGKSLPAKANLLVRWARDADRCAGYVPFPNPLAR